MSLIVRGASIFHGDPPRALEGDLWLEGGVVRGDASAAPEGTPVLDASGCVVMPGLVIGHHHLYSTLARGMPPPPGAAPTSFVEVLEKVWWRLDRALDGELNEVSAQLGALEALGCGVTGIVDHHASPEAIDGSLDRIAAGVRSAGARGVLCYEATDRHGEAGFEAGLAENVRFAGAHDGLVRAMVGGHAPFTLSDPHLTKLAEAASAADVAVHLHVAEDAHDQSDARARGAADVTARLEAAGVLSGKAVIAHGVHLSEGELERLRGAGAWLTHQPRSNMNNHVGYLHRARAYGDRLALGTDGINGDLFAEAQAAYYRLRCADRDGAAESVWSWLGGAWRLMSSAFGLEPEQGFGWLVPGAPADLLVLDYDGATPVHAGSLPWHLAFGLGSRHVRDVVVAGEVVVRDRAPQKLDLATVRERSHAAAERLWARMAEL